MSKVIIKAESCKSCRYCIEFCPKNVLDTGTEVNKKGYPFVYVKNPDDCIGCGHRSVPVETVRAASGVPECERSKRKDFQIWQRNL